MVQLDHTVELLVQRAPIEPPLKLCVPLISVLQSCLCCPAVNSRAEPYDDSQHDQSKQRQQRLPLVTFVRHSLRLYS